MGIVIVHLELKTLRNVENQLAGRSCWTIASCLVGVEVAILARSAFEGSVDSAGMGPAWTRGMRRQIVLGYQGEGRRRVVEDDGLER